MLRFQHISHLFALGVIPLLILLFIWVLVWRRKKFRSLGEQRLMNEQLLGFIAGRNSLKFILASLALSVIIIGWANLQMGASSEKAERKGVDVIIALDVSKSMLAKDISPDRLTRSKQLIRAMMDKMSNDRVGLIVFAGRSYLQVPLTTDYSAMSMLLQNVTPDYVPTQGTVISEAVDLATRSFSEKEKKYKSLIIISDGEDHDEAAADKVRAAAEDGVIVHTVGVGSPDGTTIVDPATNSVKLDDNGEPVISKLNEKELRSLASLGRGTYTLLGNTDKVANKLVGELDGMEQKKLGSVVFEQYASYFQYFLLIGFALLLIEWLLPSGNLRSKTKTA